MQVFRRAGPRMLQKLVAGLARLRSRHDCWPGRRVLRFARVIMSRKIHGRPSDRYGDLKPCSLPARLLRDASSLPVYSDTCSSCTILGPRAFKQLSLVVRRFDSAVGLRMLPAVEGPTGHFTHLRLWRADVVKVILGASSGPNDCEH